MSKSQKTRFGLISFGLVLATIMLGVLLMPSSASNASDIAHETGVPHFHFYMQHLTHEIGPPHFHFYDLPQQIYAYA